MNVNVPQHQWQHHYNNASKNVNRESSITSIRQVLCGSVQSVNIGNGPICSSSSICTPLHFLFLLSCTSPLFISLCYWLPPLSLPPHPYSLTPPLPPPAPQSEYKEPQRTKQHHSLRWPRPLKSENLVRKLENSNSSLLSLKITLHVI